LFSAHTKKHAQITIDCLLAGGSDYICKPQNDPSLGSLQEELLSKIINLSSNSSHTTTLRRSSKSTIFPPSLICIATSTGGPDTLKLLLNNIEPHFSIPILIVQHMPPLFTKLLAQTLSRQTQRSIVEAKEHAVIHDKDIILARGGTHLIVEKKERELHYRSSTRPPVLGLRPAADLLFSSAAQAIGSRTLGIILTGMGQDGTKGARSIHESGGSIIIQDKKSSIIWGMPGSVARSETPAKEQTILEMAHTLNQFSIT
jgi:two-component system chemotaxis response regulator CheB